MWTGLDRAWQRPAYLKPWSIAPTNTPADQRRASPCPVDQAAGDPRPGRRNLRRPRTGRAHCTDHHRRGTGHQPLPAGASAQARAWPPAEAFAALRSAKDLQRTGQRTTSSSLLDQPPPPKGAGTAETFRDGDLARAAVIRASCHLLSVGGGATVPLASGRCGGNLALARRRGPETAVERRRPWADGPDVFPTISIMASVRREWSRMRTLAKRRKNWAVGPSVGSHRGAGPRNSPSFRTHFSGQGGRPRRNSAFRMQAIDRRAGEAHVGVMTTVRV